MIYKEFRPDGFPLCPNCGEDELYLTFWQEGFDVRDLKEMLEKPVEYRMKCYCCTFDSLMEKYVSKTK